MATHNARINAVMAELKQKNKDKRMMKINIRRFTSIDHEWARH